MLSLLEWTSIDVARFTMKSLMAEREARASFLGHPPVVQLEPKDVPRFDYAQESITQAMNALRRLEQD